MELIAPDIILLLWTTFPLTTIVLWIIALNDTLRHQFRGQHEKLLWVLLILFLPIMGAILYFFIGRSHRIKYNH